MDGAIEVASYLRKNEDLTTDQALKVVSMCLPSLFSFSAPLIRWPEADFNPRLYSFEHTKTLGI